MHMALTATSTLRTVGISIALATLLAACGGSTPAAPVNTVEVKPSAAAVTVQAAATATEAKPLAALEPTAAATDTVLPPTSQPTASATPAQSPTAPPYTLASIQYDGLAQGFEADGTPFLGRPDAPITLYDYSDFL